MEVLRTIRGPRIGFGSKENRNLTCEWRSTGFTAAQLPDTPTWDLPQFIEKNVQ